MLFEFFLLFKRSIILTIRSPIGIIFLIIMAFGNSFILSTVFGGVGKEELKIPKVWPLKGYDKNDPLFVSHNSRIVRNWLGTVSFIATDQFVSMSMA